MFFKKKPDPSMLFPTFIVIGVIVSVLAAVIIYVAKNRPTSTADQISASQAIEQAKGVVSTNYNTEIVKLRDWLAASSEDGAVMAQKVDEVLFSVRVPQEKLEEHFKAVLAVRTLQRSIEGKSQEEVKTALQTILSGL